MIAPVTIQVLPPVPVESATRRVLEPAGDWTIADVVDATGLDPETTGAALNERVIPRGEWATTVPQPGDRVIVSERPGIFAAFLALYAGAGATLATASTAAIIGAAVSTIAVSVGVSMLAQSLLAPEQHKVDAVPPGVRRTIAGDSNAFTPYATIPQVLGRHRLFPPLAARGYTLVEDGKLYQYAVFCFGYGQLALSDLRIGNDPLFRSSTTLVYTGTMLADADAFVLAKNASGVATRSSVELELRAGTNSDAALTLFSADIQEQPVGIRLRNPGGAHTRRTVEGTTRITVIVSCSGGLIWRTDSGSVKSRTVRVRVEYRSASSTGAWTSVTESRSQRQKKVAGLWVDIGANEGVGKGTQTRTITINEPLILTGQTMSSVHRSRTWEVPEGTYDVRLERISEEGEDPGIIDATEWTSLLSHRAGDPIEEPGLCLVAAKIQITGRFAGIVNQFNAVAQTVCPDWTGSAWTTRATSNPASLLRLVLQGPANKRPVLDAQINLTALAAWHSFCATKGFQFNAITQGRATVLDVLRQVATAGRASPGLRDGLFSVVLEPSLSGDPVQYFTPRNMRAFQEQRAFRDVPHALKVQFVDPDTWLDTERIVPDDDHTETTATTFDRLDIAGITDPDQAYKIGRYHLAVMKLRPSRYEILADFEALDCVRGDFVRICHDSILVGLASGRVRSVTLDGGGNCTGIVVDQECPMASGSYEIRVRKSDGSTVQRAVTTAAGNQTTLSFATSIASGSPMPVAGDLFVFGEVGEETIDCVVQEIEPDGDLGARLVLVDANPAILTADSTTIPDYDSHVTIPPTTNPAAISAPRVAAVTTTTVRDGENRGGAASYGVRLTLNPAGVTTT